MTFLVIGLAGNHHLAYMIVIEWKMLVYKC